MANTAVLRVVGQTQSIAVSTSSSTSVFITPTNNDQANYAAFLNTGTNPVAVVVSPAASAPAAVFPVTSTLGGFVLPASMTQPVVLAVPYSNPGGGFSVTAITATGSSTLYVTAIGDQS